MKTRFRASFRLRLFAAMLCVSLIPLSLALIVMSGAFRSRQRLQSEQEAARELQGIVELLNTVHEGFSEAAELLASSSLVREALGGEAVSTTAVNATLYSATENLRKAAYFELCDSEGRRRFSTLNRPGREPLSVDWGVLKEAGLQEGLVYSTTEDSADSSVPLMRGALALRKEDSGEILGYVVMEQYREHFQELLEGSYGAQNALLLLSSYWRPVYCADPTLLLGPAQRLREHLLSDGQLPRGGEDSEVIYSVSPQTASGLYAVLRRPNVFTRGTDILLLSIAVLSILLGFLVSLIMSYHLSRQLVRPIDRLHSAMREVTLDRLDTRVEEGEDELGELAGRFNLMIQALRENREALFQNQARLVQNQRELNEAEIRMLQAQLNPHFLCNTLDTMKWMGKIHRIPQIALMSTDLADILRFAISPEEFVSLKREAEVLERYLEIQQIRHSGKLSFALDIPPELEPLPVPKMLLQPLVENAILHGLDGISEGAVSVRARKMTAEAAVELCMAENITKSAATFCADGTDRIEESGREILCITVEDNGCGLPEELCGPYRAPEGEAARHHLGLYNVDTILKKHYGERYGLWLRNRSGKPGAVVIALLPLGSREEVRQDAQGTDC